jgi:hypothetical protein
VAAATMLLRVTIHYHPRDSAYAAPLVCMLTCQKAVCIHVCAQRVQAYAATNDTRSGCCTRKLHRAGSMLLHQPALLTWA